MKKFAIALAFVSAAAWAETWSGTVSDSHCGAKHADVSEKSMACAKKCVDGGADAVFVTGDKVLKIANPAMVKEHVGHKVNITGKLDGDTVTVESVDMK